MKRALDLDRMAELRERGLSYARIAELFTAEGVKVSRDAIEWQCFRLGVVPPPGTPYERAGQIVRPFTAEEDARLLALEAQGLNASRIARLLGRRPQSIRARLLTLARRDAMEEAA